MLYEHFARPRPYDVTIIGRWGGFSMPSPPVAVLAVVAGRHHLHARRAGPPAHHRQVDHRRRSSAVFVARPPLPRRRPPVRHRRRAARSASPSRCTAFRFFTPNEVFPVTYRRGKTAHLDVGGRRGEAIRQAVSEQLGLDRARGQARRTRRLGRLDAAAAPRRRRSRHLPLRQALRHEPRAGRPLVQARPHDPLRPARGRDARSRPSGGWSSTRTTRCACCATSASRPPRPTASSSSRPSASTCSSPSSSTAPRRSATQASRSTTPSSTRACTLVRRLWDAGLAHRDIKPANLLVRDGHVLLIDVAFVQVRPSPWRQAVDLANMMLVLAVRTDAERVYQRALQFFTPDEIAEAFAAARGVASPTQLRAVMKQDGRDLIEEFRALAPARPADRAAALERPRGWPSPPSSSRLRCSSSPRRSACSRRRTTSASPGPRVRHRRRS